MAPESEDVAADHAPAPFFDSDSELPCVEQPSLASQSELQEGERIGAPGAGSAPPTPPLPPPAPKVLVRFEDSKAGTGGAGSLSDSHTRLFPFALWVPGTLHLISNAEQETLQSMKHWSSFYMDLRHVCRFFLFRWTREAFTAECVALTEGAEAELNPIRTKVLLHRWGSVFHFLRELLSVESHIRQHWNHKKILQLESAAVDECEAEELNLDDPCLADAIASRASPGSIGCLSGGETAQAEMSGQHKKTLVALVHRAVMSDLFWTYARMTYQILGIFESIAVFAESCPCHDALRRDRTWSQFRGELSALHVALDAADGCSCCLQGRRAPELAAGFLHSTLDSLNAQQSAVIDSMTEKLTPKETPLSSLKFRTSLQRSLPAKPKRTKTKANSAEIDSQLS